MFGLKFLNFKFSQSSHNFLEEISHLRIEINQKSIKSDLEVSFLKTKVNLLEETLNNKTNDLKTLEAFKENNAHLLELLDKYDIKLSQMQDDIDVRDLRISQLVEKYQDSTKGRHKSMKSRVEY